MTCFMPFDDREGGGGGMYAAGMSRVTIMRGRQTA